MRHLSIHIIILIVISLLIGLSSVFYQIYFLKIPVTKSEIESSWIIDAKVELPTSRTLRARMFLPPENPQYKRVSESFVPEAAYGQKIEEVNNNRVVTLSTRDQTTNILYYRLFLVKDNANEVIDKSKGTLFREPIKIEEGPESIAVDAILKEARSKSADTETIVSQTIKIVNTDNGNISSDVKILLTGNVSLAKKYQIIELVLSQAKIQIERVYTVKLQEIDKQTPELWLRTFVNDEWLYFNSQTGAVGLPDDRFIWWYGDSELVQIKNNKKAQVSFTVKHTPEHALNVLRAKDINANGPDVLNFSLYDLPLETQNNFLLMLMIPIGVLVILILRNIIGISTLGTFTPVLIALAFRETSLVYGIILFSLITSLGLAMRSYLESLKLQMLPRLSIVLTFVVILIAVLSLMSHKLGIERGLSITLFPMVILTMTIERLSITWEERGSVETFKVAVGTMFAASLAFLLMNIEQLAYFVFTFPAILLVLIAFMLLMGRYRGYRLTELFRFKALIKE